MQLSVIDEPVSLDLLTRERLSTTTSHQYTVQPRISKDLSFLHKQRSRVSELQSLNTSFAKHVKSPTATQDILRKVGSPVRTLPPAIAEQMERNKNSNTVFP